MSRRSGPTNLLRSENRRNNHFSTHSSKQRDSRGGGGTEADDVVSGLVELGLLSSTKKPTSSKSSLADVPDGFFGLSRTKGARCQTKLHEPRRASRGNNPETSVSAAWI